ncbi:MAG: RHS repeat-associated core domain-containing protein, partial [Candidatus Rokuibacteriota bacterium]
ALGTRTRRSDAAGESRYLGEWMEQRGGETIRLIHGRGIDNVLAEVADPTVRHLVPDGRGDVVRVRVEDGTPPPLLAYGSFESDQNADGVADGWQVIGNPSAQGGTWSLDSTRAHTTCGRSMKLAVPVADSSQNSLQVRQTGIPRPPPGTDYRLSACFWLDAPLQGQSAQVTPHDGVTTFAAITSDNGVIGGWDCRPSQPFQLPAGSANLQVRSRLQNPGTGTVWVDNVRFVKVDGSETPASAEEPSPEESRRYEAFGTVRRRDGGPAPVERGFAGRPLEGSTGLVYLRARHYDPATGRFLQPDPLGIDADQLYAYARSNPYVYRDPTGLAASRGAVNNGSALTSIAAASGPARQRQLDLAVSAELDFLGIGIG